MPDKNLVFANIVPTPTTTAWSQTYNAGKLFAVLSLYKDHSGEDEKDNALNVLGKQALEILEKEFFSLEKKSLEAIKDAVVKSSENLPNDNISFIVATFSENILYIVIAGAGKVDIKRDESIGTLIESKSENKDTLKSGSGFVKDGDTIVLQTKPFSEAVNSAALAGALENEPSEIVESLAPIVHGREDGGASAIVIKYKTREENLDEYSEEKREEKMEEENITIETDTGPEEESREKTKSSLIALAANKLKDFNLNALSHPKKLYLSVALIIAIVFVFSVFLAVQKQNNAKLAAIFNDVYPKAEKKYQEGVDLSELNENLARDSFLAAQKILKDSLADFPEKSDEKKQIEELLAKIEKEVGNTSGIKEANAIVAGEDASEFLNFINKTTGASVFTQDENNIYYLEKNNIYTYSRSDKESKEIIKNDSYWKDPAGMGTYFGNIYVADKKDGVAKFVKASGDEYGHSSYFGADSPNLSLAKDMTIDNSVWVLLSDGTILKFTRGKSDGFKINGLDKSLSSPSKIYTNTEIDYVYILDNGNSRIVVLEKNGSYKAQYQAGILKSAKNFEVKEGDKKIFVLSSGKIYQIELK